MTEPVDGLRLVGPTGSNRVMAGEMSRLSRRAGLARVLGQPKKLGLGALRYPFDRRLAVLAARHHRTCARVLQDLYDCKEDRLEPLYEGLRAQVACDERPWLSLLHGTTTAITVNAWGLQDFAAGERQVVGTVKNALVDGAGQRGVALTVAPEQADLMVDVRFHEGTVMVALDLAGRPMNQRGYRQGSGPAPLRENLAATLVMLARHDPRTEFLLDPMAGTGTVGIEAACLAQGRPVFLPGREPLCERMAEFASECSAPAEPLFADTQAQILVNEQDTAIATRCREQVARAQVEDQVECVTGDFRELDPGRILDISDGRGVVVCNPPYGVRLDDAHLESLYDDLGRFCRELRGFRAAFLVANPEFDGSFGRGARVRPRIKKPLSNASLRGQFLMYDL